MTYSKQHKKIINDAIERGLQYKYLMNPEYPIDLVQDIYWCLEYNVDPRNITKYDFNRDQRWEIILGMDSTVPIRFYAHPAFNADQMLEIRWGLESRIDIREYADPSIPAEEMRAIREYMMDVDVSDVFECGNGLEEIQKGVIAGLDVTWYNSLRYTPQCRWEIRVGLEEGLDVSWYAHTCFYREQMMEIRHGLEAGVDVSIYANPDYECETMQEIKRGLIQGFDMRSVLESLPEVTWERVLKARTELAMKAYQQKYMNNTCLD